MFVIDAFKDNEFSCRLVSFCYLGSIRSSGSNAVSAWIETSSFIRKNMLTAVVPQKSWKNHKIIYATNR